MGPASAVLLTIPPASDNGAGQNPYIRRVSHHFHGESAAADGASYPRGLKGEEIPLSGRIMGLVDAYSAMILDRPYWKALTHEQAAAELRKHAGSQFDATLVEPFVALLEYKQAAAA